MTSLPLHAFFTQSPAKKIEVSKHHQERLAMKALLLGIVVASWLGPLAVMQVDQTQWAFEFCWSMAGGSLGVVIYAFKFGEDMCLRKLAKVCITNFAAAVAAGPFACEFVSKMSGMELNPPMLMAIGCAFGVIFTQALEVGWPIWQRFLASWMNKQASSISGDESKN